MREFFRAHEKRFARGVVPAAGLLFELLTTFQNSNLTADLESECAPHAADRVHVLDLNLRSELILVFTSNRDVAIAAELALLHISVAHPCVDQHLFQGR